MPLTQPFLGIADPVSALSHLAGALICLIALFKRRDSRAGSIRDKLHVFTFQLSCFTLFSASGIYHLLAKGSAARTVFQRLDYCAIFLLIGASFTAVQTIEFEGRSRTTPIKCAWVVIVIAIVLNLSFFGEYPFWVAVTTFLTIGWLAAANLIVVYAREGFGYFLPIFLGCLSYTIGAVIELAERPVVITGVLGPHECFHFFVLAAVAFHWRYITYESQSVAEIVENGKERVIDGACQPIRSSSAP